jgi:hypothetical protein
MIKNISKSFALLSAFVTISTISFSQSIAPQSINSSGSKMNQSNVSLTFTVGELVVSRQTDSNGNTLGGGFVSGATLTTLSVQETDTTVLNVKVFPNPTTDLVNIQINHSTIDQLIITITDLQGKEIYCGKYSSISNLIGINTANYSAGTYMLSLKKLNNQVLGIYKIIKH